MPFVSYAQNREDVLLRRALADVSIGFYVDVGAQDPDVFSVTKAFYEAGWTGINIEPVQFWYQKLAEARPKDTNIRAVAGTGEETIDFYEIEDTGLSTIDEQQAAMHREAGFKVKKTTAPVRRLDAILAEEGVTKIHFLKIDVEGAEKDVLLSIDLQKWRPWVVVVEATIPMSDELADPAWEDVLIAAAYEYVYFDGLNKYFVPQERGYLKNSFIAPPNVFDRYLTADEKKGKDDEAKLAMVAEELEKTSKERNAATKELGEVSTQLQVTAERLAETVGQLGMTKDQLGVADERIVKLERMRRSLVDDNQRLTLRVAEKRAELEHRSAELNHRTAELNHKTAELARLHADAANLHNELHQSKMNLERAHAEAVRMRARGASIEANIQAIHRSTSWRITKPIRSVRMCGRGLLVRSYVLRRIYMTFRPVALRIFRVFFRR
ncbi:FkbM family methyltransferase [Caballeronia sp. M23-90]